MILKELEKQIQSVNKIERFESIGKNFVKAVERMMNQKWRRLDGDKRARRGRVSRNDNLV